MDQKLAPAEAEQFKNLGNDFLKKKSSAQAVENYTKAIGKMIINN